MATAAALPRNPLATRPQSHHAGMSISPCRTTLRKASAAVKRPHSPEPSADKDDQSSKRAKTTLVAPAVQDSPTQSVASRADAKKEKERKKERDKLEFKSKYSRAFPGFVFYFDLDTGNPEIEAVRMHLYERVKYMNGQVEDFFSKDITHFITLHDVDEKENKEKDGKGSALGSPIRLRGRNTMGESLLQKARSFDMKVWSVAKLHGVLDRCDAPRATLPTGSLQSRAQRTSRDRNLARLLETERLHGTTERDPSQRRHDYVYFSKDSYFVLVEDIRGELATITATEYPIQRTKDGKEKGNWPVLHLHPMARGPFLEYDDKEERRRQKTEKAEQDRQSERARRKARLLHERKRRAQQQPDLRRCASMNNLKRRATFPDAALEGYVDLDEGFAEDIESANASGYLASAAYMAASGNSVNVTSTTGTTSAAGGLLRTLQLPPHIKEKMQQQVTMQRRASALPPPAERNKENVMGPPTTIPDRAKFLRKSKSTNTLKLPKRDEQSKPGYCECCRVKFENFKDHIVSRKHRKFAMDDNNFKHLDAVLSRVKRRTVEEVEEANERFLAEALAAPPSAGDEDELMLPQLADEEAADDVHWDEWVDAAKCEIEIEA
ncbi:Dfp1/Him1, central region-domain-containing protein [Cerioporus squamosus]|nr:Dfp1/Him1, central region-domain-containing protein [Cerioporus squamosus]